MRVELGGGSRVKFGLEVLPVDRQYEQISGFTPE